VRGSLWIFGFFFLATQFARGFDTVVLDPGHGGLDAGSYWYGIKEKDLALDLGKRMRTILEEKGIRVVMTRETDVYPELSARAALANKETNAIFVSLHFNAVSKNDITGIEVFHMSAEGEKLGYMVQNELTRRLNTKNRGVKRENLKVLRDTKCTSILIEGGFLSNRWECQRCAAPWYRQILAEEIVQGLMRYR
tara:strand:+ start:2581 stop:3162 length:582 start_codon:yes stop_codon:yes gene_type:complete